MWKNRVVIPGPGRRQLLNELHLPHIGMAKMKSLACMYQWWPKIDDNIERMARQCQKCQEQQPEAISTPLQPWNCPSSAWNRIRSFSLLWTLIPNILIEGLKIEFSMTMILFTFVITPEPQTFDGYLDGLKDELEM